MQFVDTDFNGLAGYTCFASGPGRPAWWSSCVSKTDCRGSKADRDRKWADNTQAQGWAISTPPGSKIHNLNRVRGVAQRGQKREQNNVEIKAAQRAKGMREFIGTLYDRNHLFMFYCINKVEEEGRFEQSKANKGIVTE